MKYLFYSVAFVCRIIFLACVGVVSGQRRTLKHLAQHASWNQFRVSTKQMSQHSIRDKCHSCQPSRFQVDGYKRETAGGLILGCSNVILVLVVQSLSCVWPCG